MSINYVFLKPAISPATKQTPTSHLSFYRKLLSRIRQQPLGASFCSPSAKPDPGLKSSPSPPAPASPSIPRSPAELPRPSNLCTRWSARLASRPLGPSALPACALFLITAALRPQFRSDPSARSVLPKTGEQKGSRSHSLFHTIWNVRQTRQTPLTIWRSRYPASFTLL